MQEISITLPIYQTIGKRTSLIGLNWYRNSHYHVLNKVKKLYSQEIFLKLRMAEKQFNKYSIEYKLYYKNRVCDLMNVVSVIDKFFQDAIQDCGIVKNDNVNNCIGINAVVGGLDKENPRIEIILKKDLIISR